MLKADCAVVSWKLKNRRKNNKYTLHQRPISIVSDSKLLCTHMQVDTFVG